jgi:hypothetical protein
LGLALSARALAVLAFGSRGARMLRFKTRHWRLLLRAQLRVMSRGLLQKPESHCFKFSSANKKTFFANPCGIIEKGFENWLRGLDLNQRPSGYEPDELPDCSTPRQRVNLFIVVSLCDVNIRVVFFFLIVLTGCGFNFQLRSFLMTLLIPMAVMVVYILAVGVYSFSVRSGAVRSKKLSMKYFLTYDPALLGDNAEYVVRVGRHYDNLLQIPLLFLVTGALCLFYGLSGWLPALLGWVFFFSRVVHTYIHLGSNNIVYRFLAYGFGWLIILALWGLLLFQGFSTQLV